MRRVVIDTNCLLAILITQDPDDNKFIDCAVAGQAEILVSNDKHFKIIKEIDFPAITILKLQEFTKMLDL